MGAPRELYEHPGQPVRDELRRAGQPARRRVRAPARHRAPPSARTAPRSPATVERLVHLGFEVRVDAAARETASRMSAQLTRDEAAELGVESRRRRVRAPARRARVRRRRRQHGRGRGGCPGARAERHRSRAAGPRTALEDPARGGGALRRPACWYGWCAAGGEHRCPTPAQPRPAAYSYCSASSTFSRAARRAGRIGGQHAGDDRRATIGETTSWPRGSRTRCPGRLEPLRQDPAEGECRRRSPGCRR